MQWYSPFGICVVRQFDMASKILPLNPHLTLNQGNSCNDYCLRFPPPFYKVVVSLFILSFFSFFFSFFLSFFFSIYHFISLSLSLSLSVCLSLPLFLPFFLSIYLSFFLSICLSFFSSFLLSSRWRRDDMTLLEEFETFFSGCLSIP